MQHDSSSANSQTTEATEHSVAQLLKLSGERGSPAAEATARAHAAALDAWQESLRQTRAARRRHALIALAASVAFVSIGLVAWTSFERMQGTPRTVAQVIALSAPTTIIDPDERTAQVDVGAALRQGHELHTRAGRASLAVGDSVSLRLDTNTQIRFDGEDRIQLLAGAVYVDSGGLNAASDLLIVTPAGHVRHEGTQYQVRVDAGLIEVKVREGRVLLMNPNAGELPIVAGEQVQVRGQTISRGTVPSFGPDWDWASTMATVIDIDNRPLIEFLNWITREHGWQLRYASENVERAVYGIRLHGSAKAATPTATLQRVALITGLSMTVENGVLLVASGQEPAP